MENKERVMEITEEIMETQTEVRNEIDMHEENAQQSGFWKDERGVGVIEIVLI